MLGSIRDRDHTRGSLVASLAALSVPAILTSLVGFGTFQIVDLRFLASLGDVQVAAAGATNHTLRQFFMLMFMGITVGSQMLIARFVGQRQADAADHIAGQTFLVGASFSLVAAVAGLAFPEALVSLVAEDPAVISEGTIYLRIVFVTFAIFGSVQIFNAILSGAGDTTTPMMVTAIVTPLSILAEWVLAFGHLGFPALGIAGIGLGAAVGSAGGVMVAGWALFAGRCRVHLRGRHFVPDLRAMGVLGRVSWQPALHMVARSFMLVFFMWLAGQLGGKVQAAYTIGLRVEMVLILIVFPLSNACATLVGQNLGAGDVGRAWSAIRASFAVSTLLMWPVCVGLFLYRTPLVELFTDDPEVAAMAAEFLAYTAVVLAFYGLYFVSFRTLQASGDMNTPMWISLGAAVFAGAPIGWFLAARGDLGATGMWIANLVYATINTLLMTGWLLTGRWARPHRAAALEVRDAAVP